MPVECLHRFIYRYYWTWEYWTCRAGYHSVFVKILKDMFNFSFEIHKAMFFFCFVHRQSLYYTRNETSIKITRDAHFNRTRVCLITYHPAYQPCFIRPLISVTDIMYCKVTVPTISMHSQPVIIWHCVTVICSLLNAVWWWLWPVVYWCLLTQRLIESA